MGIKTITAADLFCGAGGTSEALRQSCEKMGVKLKLIAVNHWQIAIETHSQNHPSADSVCANLDTVDPRKLVPSGKLDLLVASPECTHHSVARGGKPINDQSRASAWRIVEWCSQIRVEQLLIENVKEFRTWGPLGVNGRPLKRRKGETYFVFLNALRALGYTVEDRILNAADYGDPTSRQRLFIQARLGRKSIQWPEPTHGPSKSKIDSNSNGHLFDKSPIARRPYRTAREIIDWSIPGASIFNRKRALAENTLNRIFRGLEKFAGLPFIVPQLSGGANRGMDQPIPTITTTSRGIGLCQPFIVELRNGQDARSIDQPLSSITTLGAHHGICQLFIIELRQNLDARSLDRPLSTITASGTHHGLCQPFLIRYNGNHNGRKDGDARGQNLDEPISSLDTSNRLGLVQPFIMPINHGKTDFRSYSIDKPFPTITSVDAWSIIEPYLVKFNGTGGAISVDEPLHTVISKDRFALVEPTMNCAVVDILFRMLQPHELAAAMSFPKSYFFFGNREQKVKQIGNAVPVRLGEALFATILSKVK